MTIERSTLIGFGRGAGVVFILGLVELMSLLIAYSFFSSGRNVTTVSIIGAILVLGVVGLATLRLLNADSLWNSRRGAIAAAAVLVVATVASGTMFTLIALGDDDDEHQREPFTDSDSGLDSVRRAGPVMDVLFNNCSAGNCTVTATVTEWNEIGVVAVREESSGETAVLYKGQDSVTFEDVQKEHTAGAENHVVVFIPIEDRDGDPVATRYLKVKENRRVPVEFWPIIGEIPTEDEQLDDEGGARAAIVEALP